MNDYGYLTGSSHSVGALSSSGVDSGRHINPMQVVNT